MAALCKMLPPGLATTGCAEECLYTLLSLSPAYNITLRKFQFLKF